MKDDWRSSAGLSERRAPLPAGFAIMAVAEAAIEKALLRGN